MLKKRKNYIPCDLKFQGVPFREYRKSDYTLNYDNYLREFMVYDRNKGRTLGLFSRKYMLESGFTKSQLDSVKPGMPKFFKVVK